ncbi:MAG: DUF4397 domain-containing protein [Antricoccus sp.]
MRRILTLLAAAFVALAGLIVSGPAAHAADTASVSVVHGIPGTPVNVFVNGKDTLPNFQPGTVAGPLQLPAGDYKITVFPAADTAGSGTPVITASATVTAGQNVTLVAHLKADGTPTLTPFVNDTSMIAAGKARLVVRHTAAAPAVDVRANGAVAFSGLTNPNQASADLAAGSISADVVLAGTSTVVIGPATVDLKAGTETIVYAIGSAEKKDLALVVQTITGMGGAPGGVNAGTGGFAAPTDPGTPAWVWALAGVGGLLLLSAGTAGGLRMTRARR